MNELIKNIKNGIMFQIKYTAFSLKRWPIIIILYILSIGILGILEPIEVFFQKEIIKSISNFNDLSNIIVLIVLYLTTSTLFMFQSYASPIAQKAIGLKVANWIEEKIYLNLQNCKLEWLDTANYQVKIEHAKESIIYISSGPAILIYNISYLISLLIPTFQLIKYPHIVVLYYFIGLLSAISNTKHNLSIEKQNKELRILKRELEYFSEIQQSKNIIIENRVYNYNSFFLKRWNELNEFIFDKQIQLKIKQTCPSLLTSLCKQIINFFPTILLYSDIINRRIDIATYTLIIGMGSIITRYIDYIFNALSKSSECGIYTQEIEEVLTYAPTEKNTLSIDDSAQDSSIIQMNNVSFVYPNGHKALNNINFNINKNEIVALVGENGSGKTTLAMLCLGLYEPTDGEILFFNNKLNNNTSVRNYINPVFQDYVRYEFTIQDNVGYGNIDNYYNLDMLNNSIKSSGFNEVMNAKQLSLKSYLGRLYDDNGIELSGGEWQKVAISRGIFGNGSLLILDEPTAAIDPISEMNLFSLVKRNVENRAGIIVSHRIGICKLADRIVFLQDGSIIEEGTHEELYKKHGQYYSFYNEQAKWYMTGEKNEKIHEE